MSLSDAIGQIDQIVQWEQQLADPAAATQSTSTGGVAIAGTGSTPTSTPSGSASFANLLAQAQSPDAGAGSSVPGTAVSAGSSVPGTAVSAGSSVLGTAASAGSSLLGTAASAGSSLLATAANASPQALLSGGDSQLLAALSSPGYATNQATSPSDPRIQAMIQEANSLVGKPYVWGGGHGGFGPQSGYDCSGFVSAVLHAGGYLSTPQDTTTLPQAPGIEQGPGQYVTIYDRNAPGQEGHVIIEINGQFYESGGEHGSWGGGGGVAPISTPSPEYLATFNQVLHPAGL
jgi:cell wall-associated NlpC family hydrolase